MAGIKLNRFSSHFKEFYTRTPTRVWHSTALSLFYRFKKSCHHLNWKRRKQERETQLEAEKSRRWRALSLAAEQGRLTVEMFDDMDILEALMWLEEEKRKREKNLIS